MILLDFLWLLFHDLQVGQFPVDTIKICTVAVQKLHTALRDFSFILISPLDYFLRHTVGV